MAGSGGAGFYLPLRGRDRWSVSRVISFGVEEEYCVACGADSDGGA